MAPVRTILCLAVLSIGLLPACANPHFFPRLRPLFAGLDEGQVPAGSRTALAHAKTDFMLVKHGKAPRYAQYVKSVPRTNTKVYEGEGYRISAINENTSYPLRKGPEIVVFSSITGGDTYRYDEVDEVAE
jgi:hypothetical protein